MDFKSLDKTFIIAEISANHAQDLDMAISLIRKAAECGVNAVKFQAYTPETLTIDVDNEFFRIEHPAWGGQTLFDLYKKAYTPWEWFEELKRVADEEGVLFFATAFDKSSVDFLEKLGVSVHKTASFELVDLPLIEYMAKTKKPIIMSVGMATFQEIKDAVSTAKDNGAEEIILLKCVSSYPAKPEDMNLRTIPDLKENFNCTVGVSDHTLGTGVSVTAVSLGAQVVEKHITLSRKIETPDSFFSIEPEELKQLVEEIRVSEKALGNIHYGPTEEEKKSLIFRRSLFVIKDIKEGEVFTEENIRSIRPASGIKPGEIKNILGKNSLFDIEKGTPLKWDFVSK